MCRVMSQPVIDSGRLMRHGRWRGSPADRSSSSAAAAMGGGGGVRHMGDCPSLSPALPPHLPTFTFSPLIIIIIIALLFSLPSLISISCISLFFPPPPYFPSPSSISLRPPSPVPQACFSVLAIPPSTPSLPDYVSVIPLHFQEEL